MSSVASIQSSIEDQKQLPVIPDHSGSSFCFDSTQKMKTRKKREKETFLIPESMQSKGTQTLEKVVELSAIKDALIVGEVIHLTKTELTELGFLFNDDGFFYCNKDERGYLNFYSDRHPDSKIKANSHSFGFNSVPVNQRKEITNFLFYPARLTGIRGERLQDYSRGIQSVSRYGKAYYDDLLVPVYFPGRWFVDKKSSDKILWFNVTDEFFDMLPNEKIKKAKRRVDIVRSLRAIPGNETKNFVEFNFISHYSLIVSPLALNKVDLKALGFKVDNNKIIYRCRKERAFLSLTMHPQGSFYPGYL